MLLEIIASVMTDIKSIANMVGLIRNCMQVGEINYVAGISPEEAGERVSKLLPVLSYFFSAHFFSCKEKSAAPLILKAFTLFGRCKTLSAVSPDILNELVV